MLNKSGRATRSRSCDALRGGTVAALALASLVLLCSPAIAALNIFACEPEWAALATELGGNDVSVFAATGARQDPHQVQARPALIAKLRQADLAVCTGAELEIGWLPVLLRQASNGHVQPGSAGFFAAAEQVRLKEVPTRLDRSEGDIHAAGNPHIQTDPRNIRAVAQALGQRLAQIDAAHAAAYAERLRSFTQRFDQAIQRWEQMAAPLKGTSVVSYHKSWVYLYDWVGIKGVATVEPKPGVPPGSAYLAQLLDEIPRRGAKMVVYAAYEDPRASQFVGEKSGIPAVMLPFTVGGTDQAKDLVSLFDDTIARLLAALGGKAG